MQDFRPALYIAGNLNIFPVFCMNFEHKIVHTEHTIHDDEYQNVNCSWTLREAFVISFLVCTANNYKLATTTFFRRLYLLDKPLHVPNCPLHDLTYSLAITLLRMASKLLQSNAAT